MAFLNEPNYAPASRCRSAVIQLHRHSPDLHYSRHRLHSPLEARGRPLGRGLAAAGALI